MKLVALTELEAHLINRHGVRPELVSRNRETPDHQAVSDASHDIVHASMGELADHTHG